MKVSEVPPGIDLGAILFGMSLRHLVHQHERPDILFRLRRDDDRYLLDIAATWDAAESFDITALIAEVGLSPTMTVNALVEVALREAGRADLIELFGRL